MEQCQCPCLCLYNKTVAYAVAAGALTFTVMTLLRDKDGIRCTSKADLTGKTVIVTGANTGIGFCIAEDLAARKARVILACRSLERGKAALEKIRVKTGSTDVVLHKLDLFDFNSVRKFSEQIHKEEKRLDILVNSAGVLRSVQPSSEHGLEVTMATNHFGPFLLTLLLLDMLKKSAPSRIVVVSSYAHATDKKTTIRFDKLHRSEGCGQWSDYCLSKLANVLFTRELARRLEGNGVTVNALCPGAVATHLNRNLNPLYRLSMELLMWFYKTPEDAAQTAIYLAVSEEVEGQSGKYYVDCALAEDQVNPLADDLELAKKLWDKSAELTGVSGDI